MQLAIAPETIERVFYGLIKHKVTLLHVPAENHYIFGDTPFPETLTNSFTIPLSSEIALLFVSGAEQPFPKWEEEVATVEQIRQSNRLQFDNSLKVAVGNSIGLLKSYLNDG